PSRGLIFPLSRIAGGKPAVRWTSEALTSAMWLRTAAKSKSILPRSSFWPIPRYLKAMSHRSGGDPDHLFDAGLAHPDLGGAVLAQGQHALLAGHRGDLRLGALGHHHLLQPLAHPHRRVEADPAAVAGVVAARASDRLVALELAADRDLGFHQRLLGDDLAPL